MDDLLTEEEMRAALFSGTPASTPQKNGAASGASQASKTSSSDRPRSPKLRVVLHATKTFEGDVEVLTHDANTLSTLLAEQEAISAARKKRFKYFEVVSISQV